MKTRCLALCALFCAVSLALTACGTGRTMVLEPGESRKLNSITVAEGQSTVTVSSEAEATFKNKLNELLYAKGGFHQGPDVFLTYRFLQFNEGSRFKRWFTGGVSGILARAV